MLGDRQTIARSHSDFYRDKYHSTLRKLLISTVLIVFLICVMIYLILFRAPPQYYATTTEGQIIPMIEAKS